ncbi:MAG: cysteine desulfurase CsdA [Halobacteriovorax sp.]|nr:cysteine desulfurase CsdA [Halobacteriovorax sp.]|tara:strand:- start:8381 stop:9595 length:1215 start_codon:yes stop_codon:yes gene_type:complete
MLELAQIRRDFPALAQKVHGKDLVYLDSAASALKAAPVINALHQHYEKETANVHRGVHFLSEQGTRKYEATRLAVQKFINAKFDHEVIFTKGTTDSLNLVAFSFGEKFINAGDEILISTMEHHSNIVPWQLMAQRKGAIVKEIPINDAGEIDLEAYKKLLNPKVKLVSVCHISNTLGTINPIKEMVALAHDAGAKFCVDAAQSAPHMKIDVQDLNCDFLAFSGHKIYGPTGVGILFGKEELLNQMPPYQGGGAMIEKVSFTGTTYNQLPEKFEAGTPAIAEVIALKDAIDYIDSLGWEDIHQQENELLNYATKKLLEIDGLKIIGTAKEKTSVISFVIDGVHPHDLGTLLDQQGVAVRTGHHCTQPLMERFNVNATVRASFSIYNNKEDVDALMAALNKSLKLL